MSAKLRQRNLCVLTRSRQSSSSLYRYIDNHCGFVVVVFSNMQQQTDSQERVKSDRSRLYCLSSSTFASSDTPNYKTSIRAEFTVLCSQTQFTRASGYTIIQSTIHIPNSRTTVHCRDHRLELTHKVHSSIRILE